MSEPTVTEVPESNRYELRLGDEVVGMVTYAEADGVRDLQHTEISPDHEGEGLGSKLATGVLDDIRSKGMKLRPSCPFIAGYIEKHPDYGDLVA
jgi:uncharacterized protein